MSTNLEAAPFPLIPRYAFLTRGVGRDKHRLSSFEHALRNAGMASQNLVNVSSILPPHCQIISKEKGLARLSPGQVTFCVMAKRETDEPSRLVVSSVGLAIPNDRNQYGYLSEHHAFGETDEKAGELAEDLAASMLATTLGIEFDPDRAWDEKEEVFKLSNKIVRTTNITQSARGHKDGQWTSVIAMCVLIP